MHPGVSFLCQLPIYQIIESNFIRPRGYFGVYGNKLEAAHSHTSHVNLTPVWAQRNEKKSMSRGSVTGPTYFPLERAWKHSLISISNHVLGSCVHWHFYAARLIWMALNDSELLEIRVILVIILSLVWHECHLLHLHHCFRVRIYGSYVIGHLSRVMDASFSMINLLIALLMSPLRGTGYDSTASVS